MDGTREAASPAIYPGKRVVPNSLPIQKSWAVCDQARTTGLGVKSHFVTQGRDFQALGCDALLMLALADGPKGFGSFLSGTYFELLY